MDPLFFIAALLIVAALAVGMVLLDRRSTAARIEQAVQRAASETQSELQRLGMERDEAQRRITEMAAERSEREVRLEEKSQQLTHEIERRSAAESSLEQLAVLRRENEELEKQLAVLRQEASDLKSEFSRLQTTLEEERKATQEKMALLEDAKTKLGDAFKALSSDALTRNNESFLQLAKQSMEKYQEAARGDLDKRSLAIGELVKPIRESLDKVDVKIKDLEKARVDAYHDIKGQLQNLTDTEKSLREETGNLVKALRSPVVRGRWGEMQLRRVVELAGMVNYCDFEEQPTVDSDAGRQRPDMIIHLPAGRCIVVDSKVPMESFIEAVQASDETQRQHFLKDHARQLRKHVKDLTGKSYWERFEQTPEFVVLFLPGESFFSAALEQDPSLLEEGGRHVILSTPTTLIGLLRAVAYGWREDALANNAREISTLGLQLYERLGKLGEHMDRLGRQLGQSVESYNSAIGSLESRVLVSARRFKELGAAPSGGEITELSPVETTPRRIQADEIRVLPEPAIDEEG